MAEHFTKATSEAKFWCKPCGGPTMHYVSDGRRGGCQVCIAKGAAQAKKPAAAVQGSLDLPAVNGFDDGHYAVSQSRRGKR